MQAITTKYFGPTDTRGSKVKATCEAGTLYHPWDTSMNVEENHEAAAVKLAQKLGWVGGNYGHPKGGGMKGAGYCFVFTRERDLAEAVMEWARTPGDHGGNPHCKEFVKLAERILKSSPNATEETMDIKEVTRKIAQDNPGINLYWNTRLDAIGYWAKGLDRVQVLCGKRIDGGWSPLPELTVDGKPLFPASEWKPAEV